MNILVLFAYKFATGELHVLMVNNFMNQRSVSRTVKAQRGEGGEEWFLSFFWFEIAHRFKFKLKIWQGYSDKALRDA